MRVLSDNAVEQIAELFRRVQMLERGSQREDPRAVVSSQTSLQPMYLGKPIEDVAKGASGDVAVWSGEKGNETETARTLPNVFARTQAVTTDDFVYVFYVDGGLEMNKAEC